MPKRSASALCVGKHLAGRPAAARGVRKRRSGLCALEGRFQRGFVQCGPHPVYKPPFEQGRQCTKSRSPPPCLVVYGNRPNPRWAGYGNRRKARTTGGPCDQKACTTCRRPRRPQWPADSEVMGGPGRLRPSLRTHAKCRRAQKGVPLLLLGGPQHAIPIEDARPSRIGRPQLGKMRPNLCGDCGTNEQVDRCERDIYNHLA